MSQVIAIFLITLGIGQLISSLRNWRAASLIGANRGLGTGVGMLLVALGLVILGGVGLSATQEWGFGLLLWALPIGFLTLLILLWSGATINPPTPPDTLFEPHHPHHSGCQHLTIPDDKDAIPAYLIHPLPDQACGAAVCVLHGSGDNKSNFKWQLVRALLDEGLTVLTIDLPGHGEYQHRLLDYPDCLSTVSAAVAHMRTLPDVERIGVLGISLGGAVALNALALDGARLVDGAPPVDALAVLATPLEVNVTRNLVLTEMWQTMRAPVMSLLQEMSVRQIWHSWQQGAIRSQISTTELFRRLDPLMNISRLPDTLPILLVYSQRDPIARLSFGQLLKQAAPQAELLVIKKASHVTLTLIPSVNRRVALWLKRMLC